MNKNDLVAYVAESAGLAKTAAAKAVEAVFDGIADALKKGDKVSLVGFGSFEVQSRPARKGRNPRTGQEIQIAASKLPKFAAGKGLKDAVDGK